MADGLRSNRRNAGPRFVLCGGGLTRPLRGRSRLERQRFMVWLNSLFLKSSNPTIRRRAIEAIKTPEAPRALDLINESLRDEDATVRRAAALALEQVSDTKAINCLIATLLQDPAGEVREAAAAVLGRVKSARATHALARALDDRHDAVRISAAAALRAINWQPANSQEQGLYEVALGKPQA